MKDCVGVERGLYAWAGAAFAHQGPNVPAATRFLLMEGERIPIGNHSLITPRWTFLKSVLVEISAHCDTCGTTFFRKDMT